jgi:uncharacterized protein YecE (DUF72 family)
MLEFYVQHFDTLELNNSFYRLPTIQAFECWRDSTPDDFVFAVKASRFITHNKKLKDPENALRICYPGPNIWARNLARSSFSSRPNGG